jgi:hypothetical protein
MEFDLNARIEELRSMNGLKSSRPDMPVPVVAQEAYDLYEWCQPDKEFLINAGLNWFYVEELKIRTNVLVNLESAWVNQRDSVSEFEKEWKVALPCARDLRAEMAHYFFKALASIPDVHVKVRKMSKGRSNAAVSAGLFELAELGSLYQAELERNGIDLCILDKAMKAGGDLTRLQAKLNAFKGGKAEGQFLRNKAYYHLREVVDEVRRIGKFVFWKNEERYKGYLSDFLKSKTHKLKHKNNQE